MAVTEQASAEATIEAAAGPTRNDPASEGLVHFLYLKHTQDGAGDATSTVDLRRLPAGRVRLLGPLCTLNVSAFGASRTLAVGLAAYVGVDNVAVVADGDALLAATSVATAVGLNLTGFPVIESMGGVLVNAVVAGGTIPDGATIEGVLAFTVG